MTGLHLATRVGAAINRRRPAPPDAGDVAQPAWPDRAVAAVRRHWLVSVLLAAGLVLRVLSLVAYQPAIIYIDTLKYLYGASPGADPLGYRLLLKTILPLGDLGTVALVQHLLGLAMAVALYVVLLRRGVGRWLAALAVAPVLLDAYQLQIEQMIMPDVWFEAMLVAGLVVLLWRPTVSVWFAVAAGLIFGISATFHQLGEILFLPAVVYLLACGGGWRRAVGASAALTAAFALPILLYCGISEVRTGQFWLAHGQGTTGRVAAAADCATLRLPAAVRPLCPTPGERAQGPDWIEHSGASPLFSAVLPPGTDRSALISALTSAVEHQQPLRVAVSYLEDSVRLFAATRDSAGGGQPISRWQFQTQFPVFPQWITLGPRNVILVGLQRRPFGPFRYYPLDHAYGGQAHVDRPVAAFLRAYQLDGGYTPGPLYLVFVLAGLAGSVLVLARRRSDASLGSQTQSRRLALACLLLTATAATVLLAPDIFEFSWRYQVPAIVTLPAAGVLGVAAWLSRRHARERSLGERLTAVLDVAWVPGPREVAEGEGGPPPATPPLSAAQGGPPPATPPLGPAAEQASSDPQPQAPLP